MAKRNYLACTAPVNEDHRFVPKAFLDDLIDAIDPLPDEVFDVNPFHDVYAIMKGPLGPFQDLLHRKAVMCEVLRVMAAFESDWNWNEGVDITNQYSLHHKEGEETGAFQVSFNSCYSKLDESGSLKACIVKYIGSLDVQAFISTTKTNHAFAVEYCARLLRFNTTWCGTLNDASMVIANVRRDAVEEFKSFLTLKGNPEQLLANVQLTGDAAAITGLLRMASDSATFHDVQQKAAKKLLDYDGEVYPRDGCAITLSLLLQRAGIPVPDTYQALALTNLLKNTRHWQKVALGQQRPGDVGTTCGDVADHGRDHIYLLLKMNNDNEMLVADNQRPYPHARSVNGSDGRTPTKYFLRAV